MTPLRRLLTAAGAAGLIAIGSACGSSTHSTAPSVPPSASSSPSPATSQAVSLTQPWTYPDGVKVSLSDVSRAVTGPGAQPAANLDYVRFVVTVVNGGTRTIDLSSTVTHCAVADASVQATPAVFDYSRDAHPWNSNGGVDRLLPGQTTSYPAGCQFSRDQHRLQFEIAPDFDYDTAIFIGMVS